MWALVVLVVVALWLTFRMVRRREFREVERRLCALEALERIDSKGE